MTSFKFGNVSAREIQGARPSRYVVRELVMYASDDPNRERPMHPVLIGRHAGDQNKALRSALNIANAKHARGRSAEETDEERGVRGLEIARSLWPRHVITGFENVHDEDGALVPYSPAAAEAFLRAMPNWILVGVIRHFTSVEHFAGDYYESLTPAEAEDAAGN